jgi:hypothetical protein
MLHGVLYEMAAGVIRLAVDRGVITKADLWRHGDASFWSLLVHAADPDVAAAARRVRPDVIIAEITPPAPGGDPQHGVVAASWSAHELVVMRGLKWRTIDPDVVVGPGRTQRLSELDPEYKLAREAYIARKSGEKRCARTRRSRVSWLTRGRHRFRVEIPDTPFDDSFLFR